MTAEQQRLDGLLAAIIAEPADDDRRLVYADALEDCVGERQQCRECPSSAKLRELDCECLDHILPNCPYHKSLKRCRTCRCKGTGFVDCDKAERAEFIRVQCELAKYTESPECTRPEEDWFCGDPQCPYKVWQYLKIRQEKLFSADWLPDTDGQLREWYFGSRPVGATVDRPFSYVVRRGFVAEVRCTLEDWRLYGPAIVRQHPVERVESGDLRVTEVPTCVLVPTFMAQYLTRQDALDSLSAALLRYAHATAPSV